MRIFNLIIKSFLRIIQFETFFFSSAVLGYFIMLMWCGAPCRLCSSERKRGKNKYIYRRIWVKDNYYNNIMLWFMRTIILSFYVEIYSILLVSQESFYDKLLRVKYYFLAVVYTVYSV